MIDSLLTSIVRTLAYALVPFITKRVEPRWAFTAYFALIFISTALASKIYKSRPKIANYLLIPFQTFFFTIIGALYTQLALSGGATQRTIEFILSLFIFISSFLAEKFLQKRSQHLVGKIVLPIMIFASPVFISLPILFLVMIIKILTGR